MGEVVGVAWPMVGCRYRWTSRFMVARLTFFCLDCDLVIAFRRFDEPVCGWSVLLLLGPLSLRLLFLFHWFRLCYVKWFGRRRRFRIRILDLARIWFLRCGMLKSLLLWPLLLMVSLLRWILFRVLRLLLI